MAAVVSCGGNGDSDRTAPSSTVASTEPTGSASTTTVTPPETTLPEPLDGDVLWSVPPDESDSRSVSLVEGGVLLEVAAAQVVDGFTDEGPDSTSSDEGRGFVLVEALTGQNLGVILRQGTESWTGLISSTVPLAAEVTLSTTAAEGLEAASASWDVTLYDVAQSATRWTASVLDAESPDSDDPPSLVAVTPEVVIVDVGDYRPNYVALSAQDGSRVWAIDPGEEGLGAVSPDGSRLAYVTGEAYSDQGASLAIADTATGAERARLPFPNPESVSAPLWIGNTVVAFEGWDSQGQLATLLVSVGTDGTTGGFVTVPGEKRSLAATEDGGLVVLALVTGLRAVDPTSGATVWEVPQDSNRTAELVAVRGGRVILNASDGAGDGPSQGVVLDAATGAQLDTIEGGVNFEEVGAFDGSVFVWSAASRSDSLSVDDHQVLVFKASQPPVGVSATGELVLP